MIDLNELSRMAYENTCKRAEHEQEIKTNTISALKHCAGEVVEATEAYVSYREIKNLAEDLTAKDLDEKWEGQEEPDVCEEYYQKCKAGFCSELADIICCVLTICGKENIDIEYALTMCMEKNYRRGKRGKQDETC